MNDSLLIYLYLFFVLLWPEISSLFRWMSDSRYCKFTPYEGFINMQVYCVLEIPGLKCQLTLLSDIGLFLLEYILEFIFILITNKYMRCILNHLDWQTDNNSNHRDSLVYYTSLSRFFNMLAPKFCTFLYEIPFFPWKVFHRWTSLGG